MLRVYEGDVGTEDHYRELYHGRIRHGRQFLDKRYRRIPYAYYGEESGPGVLFQYHPNRQDPDKPVPMKYGVVGLGTLTAFAKPSDQVRVYEINSQVEELARSQ